MKRAKYKAKNPNAYKRLRQCTHHEGCDEWGIVSYRDDTYEEGFRYHYRCPAHVNKDKPDPVAEAKKPQANLYKPMTDYAKWLDLASYHTRAIA